MPVMQQRSLLALALMIDKKTLQPVLLLRSVLPKRRRAWHQALRA